MEQVREEYHFTKGRVIVRGKTVMRGEAKKPDYLLFFKTNIPLAVVETKDNTHSVGAGMAQALGYAEILDVPFAYSSNGDAFLEHDRTATFGTVTREISLDAFPSPEELWQRYCKAKGWSDAHQQVNTQDYYDDGSGKAPRYYQPAHSDQPDSGSHRLGREPRPPGRDDRRGPCPMCSPARRTWWRTWR